MKRASNRPPDKSRRISIFSRCRICGCTWDRACPGGCGWAEDGLCTVCAEFRDVLRQYAECVRRISAASLGRLLREVRS